MCLLTPNQRASAMAGYSLACRREQGAVGTAGLLITQPAPHLRHQPADLACLTSTITFLTENSPPSAFFLQGRTNSLIFEKGRVQFSCSSLLITALPWWEGAASGCCHNTWGQPPRPCCLCSTVLSVPWCRLWRSTTFVQ